jgi:hypothetical protein
MLQMLWVVIKNFSVPSWNIFVSIVLIAQNLLIFGIRRVSEGVVLLHQFPPLWFNYPNNIW